MEVVPILEALHISVSSYDSKIVIESDSKNAISWVFSSSLLLWRF